MAQSRLEIDYEAVPLAGFSGVTYNLAGGDLPMSRVPFNLAHWGGFPTSILSQPSVGTRRFRVLAIWLNPTIGP